MWTAAAVVVSVLAIGLAFSLSGGNGDSDVQAQQSAATVSPPQATPPDAGGAQDAVPAAVTDPGSTEPGSTAIANGAPAPANGASATDAPMPSSLPDLTGFRIPIDGACLPEFAGHLPGAPRDYRNGTHEGVDFYGWASCTTIDYNTPVLAARDGVVMRADRAYVEITAEDIAQAEASAYEGEAILDQLRGRQIWIDHGDGVLTRYAHLSVVAPGIDVGGRIRAGQVIGFVGESGSLESVFAPGTDEHLHFEIRVLDTYLGVDIPADEIRREYLRAFGLNGDGGAKDDGG